MFFANNKYTGYIIYAINKGVFMYYQVYNINTGHVLATCPDLESAFAFMQEMQDNNLDIRPIEKKNHPLASHYSFK